MRKVCVINVGEVWLHNHAVHLFLRMAGVVWVAANGADHISLIENVHGFIEFFVYNFGVDLGGFDGGMAHEF